MNTRPAPAVIDAEVIDATNAQLVTCTCRHEPVSTSAPARDTYRTRWARPQPAPVVVTKRRVWPRVVGAVVAWFVLAFAGAAAFGATGAGRTLFATAAGVLAAGVLIALVVLHLLSKRTAHCPGAHHR